MDALSWFARFAGNLVLALGAETAKLVLWLAKWAWLGTAAVLCFVGLPFVGVPMIVGFLLVRRVTQGVARAAISAGRRASLPPRRRP